MRVLGLETSCDDTGVAVFDTERGLLAHKLYSQSQMHAEYGGVVPELASRDHIRKLLPLVREVLAEAAIAPSMARGPRLDPIGEAGTAPRDLGGVAYTMGPGLAGALLVGASVAAPLALIGGAALACGALGAYGTGKRGLQKLVEGKGMVCGARNREEKGLVLS